MPDYINNVHDKFVKERLQDKQNATDFLKIALPSNVLQCIQVETLKLSPSTFVNKKLKELFSDIVYTCKLEDGREAYCTIIIEHKSYDDPYVEFQLFNYLSVNYQRQTSEEGDFKVLIPLLFCHHSKNFPYRSIRSYFNNLSEDLMEFVPDLKVIVFDVHDISDEVIFKIRNVAISTMLLTQKHLHTPEELFDKLSRIYESLQTQEERNKFNFVFVYIMNATKKEDHIIEIVERNINKSLNKQFMTLYESAIVKGEQIGMQKGILENKTKVVLKSHKKGLSLDIISAITDLTEEEVLEILKKNR